MIRVGTDWLAAFADAARWGAQFRPASSPAPEHPAEALAARPLVERMARLGDCIGANTVGQIMAISSREVGSEGPLSDFADRGMPLG